MIKFLFWFAVIGWILGLIAHILCIAGIDVADKIPFIWILHIGIFVVWIPIILKWKKDEKTETIPNNKYMGGENFVAFL